jgi:hypothetical protein
MKKIIIISILAILTSIAGIVTAKDYPEEYLGLPGDNLNLYATMKLFQESETLEGFERDLNDQNSRINNLDLNGDNLVDYITVKDYVDGDVHTIVLSTQLNSYDTQDIAVFTVQRFDDGTARIQLIGDEALYGKNYIVEPIYADSQETPNPGYMGSVVVTTPTPVTVTTYEVATWPIIQFIYRPGYVCWHSAWSWGYYPSFWNPWRPYYWHTYYGYHYHYNHYYYSHYRYWNHYRYHRYHDFYYGRVRSYSPNVSARIKSGNYRTTYSRPDLRKRGDDLYRRTARRSTDYRVNNSNNGRTNNLKSARSRTTYDANTNSGRRTVSKSSSRTRSGSAVNRGGVNTQKSSTIRSGRTTTNQYQGNRNAVSQRGSNRNSSSYNRPTTSSNGNINRGVQQKSTTIRNNSSSRSTSSRQSYGQTKRSPSAYSQKSATKPRMSSGSSSSGSSYRQPKVSSRSSSSGSSYRQPKSSSGSSSRQPGVSSRSNSSGSRSGKATSGRSSQSRSSSGSRSGRR